CVSSRRRAPTLWHLAASRSASGVGVMERALQPTANSTKWAPSALSDEWGRPPKRWDQSGEGGGSASKARSSGSGLSSGSSLPASGCTALSVLLESNNRGCLRGRNRWPASNSRLSARNIAVLSVGVRGKRLDNVKPKPRGLRLAVQI